ncbi:MAG TPA: hypothetical protein VK503_01255, partial [Candidatus Bathyarchaeia archaeon]|nr:hypothetical protein [Candidatus Bathyarchaeia archaeon]
GRESSFTDHKPFTHIIERQIAKYLSSCLTRLEMLRSPKEQKMFRQRRNLGEKKQTFTWRPLPTGMSDLAILSKQSLNA